MEHNNQIERIHQQAIIIDGLVYGPAADSEDYFRQVRDAGVTATNVTIPAVDDDCDQTRKKISHWLDRIRSNERIMALALSAADIERTKKDGKTAIVMGTQNAVHLDDRIENAVGLMEAGLRIIQLTYQGENSFGAGCGAETDSGLTRKGKELVKELNELGILIDLSHCGYQTAMDAIAESRLPCAFTHANVRALCDHVRNKTDEQIKALAGKEGVMGIVSYSPFTDIKKNHSPAIAEYLRMVEYVVNLVGVDHVGIGLDFTPTWAEADFQRAQMKYPEIYLDYRIENVHLQGLKDISGVINITRGLVEGGYPEEDIKKILGGNFLRLFRQVWGA